MPAVYPHRIRLRGPWTCQPLARLTGDETTLPPAFTMKMPGRWADGGLRDFSGTVRCVRPFGYPGRIDPGEHVWLTFAGVDGEAMALLNGKVLGQFAGPAEFDVTELLQPHNKLVVDVASPAPTGGLWGEVALEVRATAYLKDVHFGTVAGRLHATGRAVGTAPQPLDLYLVADGHSLTETTIEASPAGTAFALAAELPQGPAPLSVRVELVNAAVIWYVVQGTLAVPQSNPAGRSS
jgi:hypothetical protein